MNIGNPISPVVQRVFFRFWRPAVLVLGLGLVAYLLVYRHLGTLLPGYAQPELDAYHSSADWHSIATNPVNAPYTVLVWLLTAVFHHHLLMTRVVATGFGVLTVVAFYLVIRQWYSFRIATLGTVLFASSAGFLHVARLGTPEVLQAGLLALLTLGMWYRHSHHRAFAGYVVLGVCALLWYVPGMFWFELVGVALIWRSLWRQMQRAPRLQVVGTWTVFAAVLVPLAMASMRNPHVLLQAAGLPPNWHAWTHVGSNLGHTVAAIGIRGIGNPLQWLDRLPLLDATERILLALGLYVYFYRERSLRAWFFGGAMVLGLLLIGLGGGVGFAVVVPLLYIFIIHGLDHFLTRWFVVFPRNPIARMVGVAVVCVMLFFSVLYQVRSYFIAWPHNAATQQTFNLPPS